ncbi:MAG: PAS domain S-box protein [Candidatus Hodarchaeales archaeon]
MSEEKYRNLFHFSNDAIFLHDLQGKILDVNPKGLDLFGYTKAEISLLKITDLHPPRSIEESKLAFEEIAEREFVNFEIDFVKKDGKRFSAEVSSSLFEIRGKKVIQGIVRDISERKKVEETLLASEEKYRTILENIEDSYYEVDLKGRFTFFNRNLSKILGYTEEEIMGMSFKQYCNESVATQVFKTFNEVYRTGKPVKEFKLEYKKKNGTIGFSDVSVSLIVDSSGRKQGFRGIIRETSERRKAEIALQEAKGKYQMLINKMEEGVVLEDSDGFFTFANPQVTNLLGYTQEELIGRHWSEFIQPDFLEMAKTETSKRKDGVSSRYESVAVGKNGEQIPIIISATPIYSKKDDFTGVLVVFTDISKLKEVEQELRKSEKQIQRIKLEEERYYAMLTHFLNNDLQKILFAIDYLGQNFNTNKELDQEIVKKLMTIIYNSSRNIELVNKIFAVLQSEVPRKTEKLNALSIIKDIVNKFSPFSNHRQIKINDSILSKIVLEADSYLYDVFYELLQFIVCSNSSGSYPDNLIFSVEIDASLQPSDLCIRIRDNYSQSISQLLSLELISSITEKWESRGHYLPIALVSVCMKYYDGTLKISPLDPKGNIFELFFPLKMVNH